MRQLSRCDRSHAARPCARGHSPRCAAEQEDRVASRELHHSAAARNRRRYLAIGNHYIDAFTQVAQHILKILKRLSLRQIVGIVVPVSNEATFLSWPICIRQAHVGIISYSVLHGQSPCQRRARRILPASECGTGFERVDAGAQGATAICVVLS